MSNLSCGCTPDASGYGYCRECTRALRAKIWRNMSPERKAFDRHVAPIQSKAYDDAEKYGDEGCCSCHINPPCDYCLSKNEDD